MGKKKESPDSKVNVFQPVRRLKPIRRVIPLKRSKVITPPESTKTGIKIKL